MAQTYLSNRAQQEIEANLGTTAIVSEVTDANLEALELVTTRQGMWIPHYCASLCLWEDLGELLIRSRRETSRQLLA